MSTASLSDFCGSLSINFLGCDDEKITDPKVKLTFENDVISPQKISEGTFHLEFKDRGQTSELVFIQLFEGESLIGYSKIKALSLMKGTFSSLT